MLENHRKTRRIRNANPPKRWSWTLAFLSGPIVRIWNHPILQYYYRCNTIIGLRLWGTLFWDSNSEWTAGTFGHTEVALLSPELLFTCFQVWQRNRTVAVFRLSGDFRSVCCHRTIGRTAVPDGRCEPCCEVVSWRIRGDLRNPTTVGLVFGRLGPGTWVRIQLLV